MNIYIHTVDGMPGFFNGDQIVTAGINHKHIYVLLLETIKEQQKKSIMFRNRNRFDVPVYSYRRYSSGKK